ncbi:alpha-tocopherol transfer protein-like isoform X2 [Haemaphysalis longicornis]
MALGNVEEESLAKLRKLLEAEPGLEAPTDPADLLRFLRLHKYDVAASLEHLKKYCAIRASAPKIFEGLSEPEKLRELTQDIVTVLPQKNVHGRVVILGKYGKWKPSKVNQVKLVQALVLCLEYVSRDPAAQISGISWVADFEGWSLGNMRFVELRTTRNFMHYLQNCVPVLLSEAHVLRQPAAFDVLYTILRPFVNHEILSKRSCLGDGNARR